MRDGITWKQDKFARHYATSGNGTQSAIAAGYSVKTAKAIASENLTKPDVTKAIAKYRLRIAERLDVSREKLVNDSAHDAEQASAKGQYMAAIAARTLIAKTLGYITDKSLNVNVDLTGSHLDALRAIISGDEEKMAEAAQARATPELVEVSSEQPVTFADSVQPHAAVIKTEG